MQQLAIEQRRLLGPRAPWHVGDIAWGLWQHEGREHEWEFRHWDDRAWAWLRLDKGTLDYDVHAHHPELIDAILDEPRARTAHAFEDDEETRAILTRHGYTSPGEALHFYVRDLTDRPETPALPDGFRERTVEDADLAERVAVHRDVWAPSRVTESSYANVRAAWPYRASLDCVIEAPDGRFAAYALLWPDDANGVGELEPVGVREEFRRRGLGAAVCTAALARWHDEGGREAIVYCLSDGACALYESVGFQRHATLVAYAR
jgi:ribosomal protein S18 acetylase RimI-like enzyme